MKYLLDTCTVSDIAKGDINTLTTLKTKKPSEIVISAITYYEVQYGLGKNPNIKKSTLNAIKGFIDDIEILNFDINDGLNAATIRNSLEKAGTPIGAYDILIASTTLTHDLILVTSNLREFERISELKLENWR